MQHGNTISTIQKGNNIKFFVLIQFNINIKHKDFCDNLEFKIVVINSLNSKLFNHAKSYWVRRIIVLNLVKSSS